jgi:acyl-CoA synthetase (AMP-forming)/AMP-acid ligase II
LTIRLILDMACQAWPERTALGPTGQGLTFGRLAADADAGAAVLRRLDARTLAFTGVNSPVVPRLLFAAAGAGIPFAPLNYRLSAAALRRQLDRLDRPVVVADAAVAAVLTAGGDPQADPLLTTAQWQELVEAQAPGEPGEPVTDMADDAPAILLFTSGTTAEPKCAVLRHANLLAYVLNTVGFGSADESACALFSVPPYHIAGIGAVLSNAYAGRRVLYLPDFTPEGWLDLVRREQVSHAMVVPTMLARVVEALDGAPARCPSLQSLAYGGARMPLPVLSAALTAFPGTGFVNAYGLTETSSTIAVLGPEDHRRAVATGDLGLLASAGRIVPGMEAQVRAPDGTALTAGQLGELWVRGAQVAGEYAGTGSVLDDDGWFPTRDRARIDDDGYLYLDGRADDIIIRGAENISPAEVEAVLLTHPAVREAAVAGVADQDWGQRLVAFVVLHDGQSAGEPELRAFVRAQARGSRTPDQVVFRTALPYTATGKLLRRELVAGLAAAPGTG